MELVRTKSPEPRMWRSLLSQNVCIAERCAFTKTVLLQKDSFGDHVVVVVETKVTGREFLKCFLLVEISNYEDRSTVCTVALQQMPLALSKVAEVKQL